MKIVAQSYAEELHRVTQREIKSPCYSVPNSVRLCAPKNTYMNNKILILTIAFSMLFVRTYSQIEDSPVYKDVESAATLKKLQDVFAGNEFKNLKKSLFDSTGLSFYPAFHLENDTAVLPYTIELYFKHQIQKQEPYIIISLVVTPKGKVWYDFNNQTYTIGLSQGSLKALSDAQLKKIETTLNTKFKNVKTFDQFVETLSTQLTTVMNDLKNAAKDYTYTTLINKLISSGKLDALNATFETFVQNNMNAAAYSEWKQFSSILDRNTKDKELLIAGAIEHLIKFQTYWLEFAKSDKFKNLAKAEVEKSFPQLEMVLKIISFAKNNNNLDDLTNTAKNLAITEALNAMSKNGKLDMLKTEFEAYVQSNMSAQALGYWKVFSKLLDTGIPDKTAFADTAIANFNSFKTQWTSYIQTEKYKNMIDEKTKLMTEQINLLINTITE